MAKIEPYQEADREGLFSVCHRTGFFGEDASPQFKDAYLFGLIIASYYIDYEPENCLVVKEGDKVVGYINGTTDTISEKEKFEHHILPRVISRMLKYTIFHSPKDVLFIVEHKIRGESECDRYLYSDELLEGYPSHLHINLLPDYQRKGLGTQLMDCFEEKMRAKGVVGLRLDTTSENRKAIPFYGKRGYTILKEFPDTPWGRRSPPGAKTLVFGKIL